MKKRRQSTHVDFHKFKPMSKPVTDSKARQSVGMMWADRGLSELQTKRLEPEAFKTDNGLSMFRMERNFEAIHCRRRDASAAAPSEHFSTISTKMGWFWSERGGDEDLRGELGVTIMLYFKTLKSWMAFFLLCTIISLPNIWILSRGMQDSVSILSLFNANLGNLGQSTVRCWRQQVSEGQPIAFANNDELICP